MKNRKTVVVAFLLVAVMLLGVGYAALTDTLRIDGNAVLSHDSANKAFDDLVYFDPNTKVCADDDSIEISTSKDVATIKVNSLSLNGDTATFELKIMNDHDTAVYVLPTIDDKSALYDPDLIGLSSNWKSQVHEIAANSSRTYILTVTCKATPTEQTETTDFAIGFSVTTDAPQNYVREGQNAQ